MKNGFDLKIEKGVPIPEPSGTSKGKGRIQLVLRALKKGDSVVLPSKSHGNAYTQAKESLGKGNYTVRPEPTGGFRVWRIK